MNPTSKQRTNFLIITPGRSGSSYLVETLNNHPEIVCREELFNRSNTAFDSFNAFSKSNPWFGFLAFIFNREKWSNWVVNIPLRYLVSEFLSKLYSQDSEKNIGFKLSLDQNHAYPQVLKVAVNSGAVLIYLTRKDKTRLALSLIKARGSNNYESPNTTKLIFDPLEVLSTHSQIMNWENSLIKSFPDVVSISYEELFNGSDQALEKIYKKLGVESFEVFRSGLQQVNPSKLEDWVENLEEILDVQRKSAD